jgi:N-acetylneuraminate synthase
LSFYFRHLPIAYNFCSDRGVCLHCVSGYPTSVNECNLAAIETIRDKLKTHFGWSDHSVNPGVIYRAIHRWGAEIIKFHLDLDGIGEEYKTGHCWLPAQIKTVIETVRADLQSDGTGEKAPAPSELSDCDWRADPGDGLRPILKTRVEWKRQ